MLNTITLTGRLTNKSEGSFRKTKTKDGTKIFGTSIAVDFWNGKENITNFFPIIGFNHSAEGLDKVAPGGRLTVNATPQIQTSELDGKKINKTVFKVNSIYIIDFKEDLKKADAKAGSKSQMHEAVYGEAADVAVDGSDW